MGGRVSTTWKKGQSGNPKGRPPLTPEQRAARSHVGKVLGVEVPGDMAKGAVAASVLTPAALSTITGSDGPSVYRRAVWALVPKALLRLEDSLDRGGDAATQSARFVIEQAAGKATETIKNIGDSGRIVVELKYVDKQLVVESPAPKALGDGGA